MCTECQPYQSPVKELRMGPWIRDKNPYSHGGVGQNQGTLGKQVVCYIVHIIIAQSISHAQLFATSWTATCQASLSFTISWSLPKLIFIELVCHPNISSSVVPFFSCLQSFPASGSFLMSRLFESGGQSIGTSASASVHPMNIHGWYSLGLTGLISLSS